MRCCPTCNTALAALAWLACGWCGASAAAPCRLGCCCQLPEDGGYAPQVELDLDALDDEALDRLVAGVQPRRDEVRDLGVQFPDALREPRTVRLQPRELFLLGGGDL